MEANSRRQRGRDNSLSSLSVAIETLNLAKDISCITPARAVFGSVSSILTMIRVRFFLFRNELWAHPYSGLDDQ